MIKIICSVHEEITSIRLYTPCNPHSELHKGVYNLIEVISNQSLIVELLGYKLNGCVMVFNATFSKFSFISWRVINWTWIWKCLLIILSEHNIVFKMFSLCLEYSVMQCVLFFIHSCVEDRTVTVPLLRFVS